MVLRHDDPRSPARQIVDEYRRLIALGELEPGAQLPSNAEMRSRYTVSNQTAQNAINALKNDGLVYSVPGKGVFVRSDLDQSELVRELADAEGQPALYSELLARLVKLEDVQQKLSETIADVKDRVEGIEKSQRSYHADLDTSPSMSDR